MKKSELLARIVELERQVRELQARPVFVPAPPLVGDPFPWAAPTAPTWPYIVTCETATGITVN